MSCGAEQDLLNVEQALQLLRQHVQQLPIQHLATQDALHYYLAEDVFASIDLPMFAQSAVDGYAVCSRQALTAGAQFNLVAEIRAGQQSELQLQLGQAARIFTGAVLPVGCNSVARQEIVQATGKRLQLTQALALDMDIRHQGEEIAKGQCLAKKGQFLNVGAIAALSMAGVLEVAVYRQPRVVAVISGDEVATQASDVTQGRIFDANAPMLQAWFKKQLMPIDIVHVADNREDISKLLYGLKQNYDVIITTGGVSVGDYDFIRPVALQQGFEQIFWKVRQKPGKPLFFAKASGSSPPCYLLGLPGNPAAVFVGIQIYGNLLLQVLQNPHYQIPWLLATLRQDIGADNRTQFLRMHLACEQGQWQVQSLAHQHSHMLTNLMYANCLVKIPAHCAMTSGQQVQLLAV